MVSDSFTFGGAEKYLVDLAQALNGFAEASFMFVSKSIEREVRERATGALVTLSRPGARLGPVVLPILSIADLRAMRSFDVVHCNLTWPGSCFLVAEACRLAGMPYSFTLHGIQSGFQPGGLSKKLLYRTLHSARGAMAVSLATLNAYEEQIGVRFRLKRVVYNPVSLPKVRAPIREGNPEIRLVTVARLTRQKGIDVLLRAVAEIQCNKTSNHPSVRVVVVGDGDQRERLQSLAVSLGVSAEFLGFRKDVQELLRDSDIFILPSYNEGLPYTILEAQSIGLPVVATRVGGIPEAVEDGVNGLLVEPGDHLALARAIDRLIGSRELRTRLALRARKNVEHKFSPESFTYGVRNFFRSITSRRISSAGACDQELEHDMSSVQ